VTVPLYNCTFTAEQFYDFQVAQIESFGGYDNYKKTAKFNLLANAARINNIAKELREINTTVPEERIKQAYYIGKIIRILFVFDAPNLPTEDDLDMDDLDEAMGELESLLLRQSAPVASAEQITELPDGTSVYDFTDGYVLPGQREMGNLTGAQMLYTYPLTSLEFTFGFLKGSEFVPSGQ